MHRMKIGLVAAIILLGLTLGVYASQTRQLREGAIGDGETAVSRAQRMHQSIARLEALDFANLVSGLSRRPAVVGVFDKSGETGRRQAAFEQCEGLNAFLQTGSARKAGFVARLDSPRTPLARALNGKPHSPQERRGARA